MQCTLSKREATWELPVRLPEEVSLAQHFHGPDDATVVIPVKDDPEGLGETLEALWGNGAGTWPARIIMVDDGSRDGGAATLALAAKATRRGLPVAATIQKVNQGPAAARNIGAKLAETAWLWFVDAGVRPSSRYLEAIAAFGRSHPAVAWTGPILSDATGLFAAYYTAQGILIPPTASDGSLDAFVTASVLVNRKVFELAGGFDECFRRAAAEDLDLGLRLRPYGRIGWSREAVARHRFCEDEEDFRKRFYRYGYGFFQFGHKWKCVMEPWPVTAKCDEPDHHRLAALQYAQLWRGWKDAAADHSA